MKQLIREAEEKGYQWIDWNVSAEDAGGGHPDADQILKNIQEDAEGRDLCVVLLHDTARTDATVEALPAVIDWFRGRDTISAPWKKCMRPGTVAECRRTGKRTPLDFLHSAQEEAG